jgi:tetratricopeptide (TPR) repeat protein
VLANKGQLSEPSQSLEPGSELAAELGSVRDQARATMLLAFVKYHRGDLDAAERYALQTLEWLERTGESRVWLQTLRQLAVCAMARGDPVLAEQRLKEALPVALESGGWLVVELYRYLAEVLVQQGRVDEARRLVDLAASDLPEEDLYARACLLVAHATVATAEGDGDGALGSWAEAVRLHEELHLDVDVGPVRLARARALRRFGDATAARAELERARETLVRTGAGRLLAEVDGELAALDVSGRAAAS